VKTTDTNYATRKSKENFANNNSNSVVLQSNAHRHAWRNWCIYSKTKFEENWAARACNCLSLSTACV